MGTEEQPVKLLLSHDPSHWRAEVLDTDVDVMFAGHTHGMQFGVRTENFQWSPVKYIYKEWAGLYREKQNKQLYVNVGYGFLGYPGRVGILPEITILNWSKELNLWFRLASEKAYSGNYLIKDYYFSAIYSNLPDQQI